MYHENVMILLGAGASIPVGIPGMVGLAERFEKEVAKDEGPREGYRALQRFGAGTDVEQLLQLANAIIDFPNHNIGAFVDEYVRGNNTGSRLVGDVSKRRNKIVREVTAFRDRLLEWLTQVCLAFDREEAWSLFETFVQEASVHGIPIFTTNYDGVLEFVAHRKRVPVVDNFLAKAKRYYWDSSLASFAGKGLRLVKMHGSIYWHADAEGRIERIDPPVAYNSEGKKVERLLIVPTRFKDIYQRNYFPLYTSFLRTLGNAKVIVIIGHSMRDDYLLAAVRDRLRDPEFRVIVLDPDFPAKEDLLGADNDAHPQVAHIPQKLEDAKGLLNQILQVGRNPDRVFSLAKDAEEVLKTGASPLVEIPSFGGWVNAGKQASIRIRIRTTESSGLVSAFIDLNKSNTAVIDLTKEVAKQWGDPPQVLGFHNESKAIRVYFPKAWGVGPHRLRVLLSGPSETLAEAERPFRIKGA
jgi:predicted CoA-binding protein